MDTTPHSEKTKAMRRLRSVGQKVTFRLNVGYQRNTGRSTEPVLPTASADVLSVRDRAVRLLYSVTCRCNPEELNARILHFSASKGAYAIAP